FVRCTLIRSGPIVVLAFVGVRRSGVSLGLVRFTEVLVPILVLGGILFLAFFGSGFRRRGGRLLAADRLIGCIGFLIEIILVLIHIITVGLVLLRHGRRR